MNGRSIDLVNESNLKLPRGTTAPHERLAYAPRFYFHLYNDVEARDPEGFELPNLASARMVAVHNARFTAAETIKELATLSRTTVSYSFQCCCEAD